MEISNKVKVFKVKYGRPNQYQPGPKGKFEKKIGPYHDLSKAECHALTKEIMANIEVDFSKPDEILTVPIKYNEERQVCKFSGK